MPIFVVYSIHLEENNENYKKENNERSRFQDYIKDGKDKGTTREKIENCAVLGEISKGSY